MKHSLIRKNSLYGVGIPPFSWYINYIGEPLYKLGRKMGLPKVGALVMANIPGSLSHVSGLISGGDYDDAALWFVVSEILCTGFFYGIHKGYGILRKKRIGKIENKTPETLEQVVGD